MDTGTITTFSTPDGTCHTRPWEKPTAAPPWAQSANVLSSYSGTSIDEAALSSGGTPSAYRSRTSFDSVQSDASCPPRFILKVGTHATPGHVTSSWFPWSGFYTRHFHTRATAKAVRKLLFQRCSVRTDCFLFSCLSDRIWFSRPTRNPPATMPHSRGRKTHQPRLSVPILFLPRPAPG